MAKEKRKKGKLTGILRMPKGSDKILHFTVLVLVLFGSVMIVDINVGQTSSNNMVVITTAVKQGLFMIAGYVAMLFAAKVFEFNWFYRLSKVIIIAMTVLLILPFFSIEQGGSNAWIYITIGSQVISLQPSEFVKPLMIVLIATYVYAAQYHKGMQKSAWKMLRVPIICFVLFSVIILAQRDIGALAILFLICAGAIQPVAYPKLRKLQVAARAAVLIGFVLVFIGMSPIGLPIVEKMADLPLLGHIAARFVNAADPTALDMYGGGYQPSHALYAITSSGIFGLGFGNSTRKYGYLTQADSDYILAIIVEELGIFGLLFITIGYGIIIFRLFRYAFKTNFVPYKIILSGAAIYLGAHFMLNVGGVSALLPLTGVPLLFISDGGSALVSAFITMGAVSACHREDQYDGAGGKAVSRKEVRGPRTSKEREEEKQRLGVSHPLFHRMH